MTTQPDPAEAAHALAEIQRHQTQVIDITTIPAWYFPAVAALDVVLGVGVDRRDPASVAVATTVFVVGIIAATFVAVVRPALRAQVRNALLGPRGVLAILGTVFAAVIVSIGLAFALRAVGFGWPATVGNAIGGLVLIIGGAWLRRYLRAVMLSNRVAAR